MNPSYSYTTHWYMSQDSLLYTVLPHRIVSAILEHILTWLTHMFHTTHSYVWHDLLIYKVLPDWTLLAILEDILSNRDCPHITLQHSATPCNTLQHTATHCNTLSYQTEPYQQYQSLYWALVPPPHMHAIGEVVFGWEITVLSPVLQCVAVCCRVLQGVSVWCSVMQGAAVWCSV